MNMTEDIAERRSKLRPLELIVQPQTRSLLSEIKNCASFAVIAGGYLRDKYYGVAIKDIDVFTSADLDVRKLKAGFSEWSVDSNTPSVDDTDDLAMYVKEGNEFTVYNLSHPTRTPIQVIASDAYTTMMSVLGGFDFGFCQIAFDGSNVLVTDAFWKDAANNTATFLKDKKLPQYSRHEQRLRAKYPHLVWVDG